MPRLGRPGAVGHGAGGVEPLQGQGPLKSFVRTRLEDLGEEEVGGLSGRVPIPGSPSECERGTPT